jgi:hypothetical protein
MQDRSGVATAWLTSVCLLGCGGGGGAPPGDRPVLFRPATHVLLGAASDPGATAIADLDRDGRLDLVVAERGFASLAVLLGQGDGTFPGPLVFPLGSGFDPAAFVVALLDADGAPDVAVVDAEGDAVAVLRGAGGGSLALVGSFPLVPGSEPSAVVAADLDEDGALDLAVADRDRSSVTVLRGLGDGTFGSPDPFPIDPGFRPAALAVGDLDRDGRLDLAAAGAEGTVAVLRGRGDGTLRDAWVSPAASGAPIEALAASDLDGDGVLDLVASGGTSGDVLVLLGAGDGTFGPTAAFPAGPHPTALALADLDRDGAIDAATAIFGTGGVSVLLGRGDGTFGPALRFGAAGSGGAGIAVGDLDRDGAPDVACANARSGDVGLLFGRPLPAAGSFTFSSRVAFGAGHDPAGLVLADVDRDGLPDLLVASPAADAVSVALGLPGGSFAAPFDVDLDAGSGPVALAAADLDRDGRLDLAVASEGADEVAVLLGTGTGSFVPAGALPLGGGARPSALALADLDRDGLLDVAVALRGTDRVALAPGLGDGTFDAAALFDLPAGFDPGSLAVSDLDRDGRPDVAVLGTGSSDAAVLLADASLGLLPPVLSPVAPAAEPNGLVASDLDADGRPDLATADRLGDVVLALRGQGDGTVLAAPGAAAGAGPTSLAAGDVDRDGADDLVTARFASDRFRVLLGFGDATFDPGADLDSGGDGPVALLLADLDRDGVLDLVVLHEASGEAVVLVGS